MEECVAAILTELRARGVRNHYTLAYQSRVGPVEWLKPYTDDSIRCCP
jgi:protoporphyrin/coproporphyrin ferrochelatase